MNNWLLGVLLALVVGVLALMAIGGERANSPEGKQKAAEREAIARCVEARDDELSELSTRRFMREMCIKMDRDFEAKWGISSREL